MSARTYVGAATVVTSIVLFFLAVHYASDLSIRWPGEPTLMDEIRVVHEDKNSTLAEITERMRVAKEQGDKKGYDQAVAEEYATNRAAKQAVDGIYRKHGKNPPSTP